MPDKSALELNSSVTAKTTDFFCEILGQDESLKNFCRLLVLRGNEPPSLERCLVVVGVLLERLGSFTFLRFTFL